MAYAIGQVVFGIDLQAPSPYDREAVDEWEQFRGEIEELYGVHVETQYSGNGEAPVYFGVDKGEIDEANTVRQHEITELFTVTDADRAAYREKVEGLNADADVMPEFKTKIAASEPSLFITWGSS